VCAFKSTTVVTGTFEARLSDRRGTLATVGMLRADGLRNRPGTGRRDGRYQTE
jgi:hypothetical protein